MGHAAFITWSQATSGSSRRGLMSVRAMARTASRGRGRVHGALAGDDLIVAAGPHLFRPLHDLLDELGADQD